MREIPVSGNNSSASRLLPNERQAALVEPSVTLDLVSLIETHQASVYRYAFRLTGSVPDAEDLTQQVFLTAHEKLGQVRDAASVRSWLFTVLRRAFLKSRRRPTPLPASPLEIEMEHVPDDLAVDQIDHELLQLALNQLPDEYKVVVLMFYFEGSSYREIAEQLQLPAGTVMSRLSRAKSVLRRRLAPQEVQPAASHPSHDERGERVFKP